MLLNPYRFAAPGGGGGTDPYFANVASLLHFDGADGSTTFTDEKGVVWTPHGGVSISTAKSQFGGASGLFDGSAGYLSATSTGFAFGTADFTIEAWVAPVPYTENKYGIFSTQRQDSSSPFGLNFHLANNGKPGVLYGWNSHGYQFATAPVNVFDGGLHFVTLQRRSGVIEMFWDGVLATLTQVGAGIDSTIYFGDTAAVIGRTFASASLEYFNGYMDDLRITPGVARYSGNFTPPAAPFPSS